MNPNDFEDLDLDSTEKEAVDLNLITAKAEEMLRLEGEVSRLEQLQKTTAAALRKISEQELPELLDRAGMKFFGLKDGRKIEITEDLYTSIPAVRKNEILTAVRERGGGDLIKNELSIMLDKGKDNAAAQIEAQAKEMGLEVERSETIAPQTYKKWVKTMLTSDKPIDLAFFGAHKVTRAKVAQ
jgi:deoxyxylulose-5-phosphate synthase